MVVKVRGARAPAAQFRNHVALSLKGNFLGTSHHLRIVLYCPTFRKGTVSFMIIAQFARQVSVYKNIGF